MVFSQVLLPYRPVLHQIAALHILETAIGKTLDIRFVNPTNFLSDDDVTTLSDKGIFTIGVGKGQTYKDLGFGSETAVIIHELRSVNKIPVRDRALDDFVGMMDLNNNHQIAQGGYLRRQPYSVPWIIRQGYRLGHDSSEAEFSFTDEEVVRRGAHVVAVYLKAIRLNQPLSLGVREQVMRTSAMRLLPEGRDPNKGPRNHQGPMTVSRYIRDMYVLGFLEEEMLQKAEWFVRVHDRAKERQMVAKRLVDAGGFSTFQLSDYREVGIWVDSNDPYLLEELGKKPLVVMRNSKGNVIIMSTKFDLSGTASRFLREEQCWYYQASPQFLANGTEGTDDTPTGLSRGAVEDTIGATVCYK